MNHNRYHRFRRVLIGAILVAVIFGMTGEPGRSTLAQAGGTLGYGSKVYGSVSATMPTITYSFSGTPGDFVAVTVDSWTGTLDSYVDLVGPDGQVLDSSTQNTATGEPMGAYLTAFLPDAGIYLLRLSGQNGSTGDYLLTLLGRSAAASTPLVFGQAVDVTVAQNAPPQFFSFETEQCPTTLLVTNPVPSFPFVVKVRDQRGQTVALLRGGEQLEDWVTVAPKSGRYEVEVLAAEPSQAGSIRLLVTCSGDNPGCPVGQPGLAGLPGAECPACGEPGGFLTGGGCPDLSLSADQVVGMASAIRVFWEPMPGASGYTVFVYGQGAGGGEVYLTHGEWEPGNPTEFTWVLPVEGYAGYRFVLEVQTEAGVLCTQQVYLPIERTDQSCPDLGLTGSVTDEAVNAVALTWGAGLGADQFALDFYAIIGASEEYGGRLALPGDATGRTFDHFPPHLDGVRFVLWMTRGGVLCSDELTLMFEDGDQQLVCPDLGLAISGHDPATRTLTLTWFGLEEIDGYQIDVYGTDAGGVEISLDSVGLPAGTITTTYVYPEGYAGGLRFVLRTVGGPLECADEVVLLPQAQIEPCAVRADQQTVPVRVGPGPDRSVFTFMPVGVEIPVIGQATGSDGNLWWEIDKSYIPGGEGALSLWVAENSVTEVGNCTQVPEVDIPPVIPGEEEPDVPPGTWGDCGSCDTCGHPATECVVSPEGLCLWDPATCQAPAPCYAVSASIDMGQCFGGGSAMIDTVPDCAGGLYNPGTTIQAHAVAVDQKCVVKYWSGCGVSGGGASISFVPPGSCTVTAHMGY